MPRSLAGLLYLALGAPPLRRRGICSRQRRERDHATPQSVTLCCSAAPKNGAFDITRRALAALETEQHFAQRYTEFLQLMVYGVKPDFAEAMATMASLVRRL